MTALLANNLLAALFFPALLLSLWLIPVAIRVSHRIDAVDRPGDDRKVHTRVVSRLGGAAMVAGMVGPLLVFADLDRTLAGFLAGALVVAATGLLESTTIRQENGHGMVRRSR